MLSAEPPMSASLQTLPASRYQDYQRSDLSKTLLAMSRQASFSEALNSGVFEPINTDCETPKARQDGPNQEMLSTSTPSVASTVSTALPSPEAPGPANNFGVVKEGSIYRSSFPRISNFEHMASLGLKTIL